MVKYKRISLAQSLTPNGNNLGIPTVSYDELERMAADRVVNLETGTSGADYRIVYWILQKFVWWTQFLH
jgi:hypothetical protein